MRLCNPVTFGLAWLIVVAIVAVALMGCAPVRTGDDRYHSGDDHIASIQSEARDAKWELTKAKATNGPAKDAHEDSAFNHASNIQQHASFAAEDFSEAAKQYGKLEKMRDSEHERDKYIGWKVREWIGWAIGIFTGLTVVGVIAMCLGWTTLGGLLLKIPRVIHPLSNGIDWFVGKFGKQSDTPQVKIVIENPAQVRAASAQMVEKIDAAGPATTPADAVT